MCAGNLLRQLDQRLPPPLTRAVARLGNWSALGALSWAAVLSAAAVLAPPSGPSTTSGR